MPLVKPHELMVLLEDLQQTFPLMAVWAFARDFFTRNGLSPETIHDFQKTLKAGRESVLTVARSRLKHIRRFATHSRSSLVEAFLKGRPDKDQIMVQCDVGLPAREGEDLCHSLREDGIRSDIHEDWEVDRLLSDSDALLLGADWLGPDLMINKWGSLSLIKHAGRLKRPVYILAEPYKHRPLDAITPEALRQVHGSGMTRRSIKIFEVCPIERHVQVI